MNAMFARKRSLKLIVLTIALALGVASTVGIASQSLASKSSGQAMTPPSGLVGEPIQEALNLNAQQTAQLEQIRRQAIENLKFIQEQMAATRTLLDAELTQTEPDLRKIVTDARTRFDAAHVLVQANIDSRLALYDGMTPEQKQTVCAAIEKHVERIALLQQLALQLLGNIN